MNAENWNWGDELPRLIGPRLHIRALCWEDASGLFGVFGDPEVIKYWSSPQLKDLDAAGALIEEIGHLFETRELFQWGVCSTATDEVLGTCTLCHLDMGNQRAELGIAIKSSAWGEGYAKEALDLLISFAFGELGLNRLEADVDPNNARSLGLFEGLGFKREGYLRERWQIAGEVQDTILLGLLRREWRNEG